MVRAVLYNGTVLADGGVNSQFSLPRWHAGGVAAAACFRGSEARGADRLPSKRVHARPPTSTKNR